MAEDGKGLVDKLLKAGYHPDLLQVSALNTNESCPVYPESIDMKGIINSAIPMTEKDAVCVPQERADDWKLAYVFSDDTSVPDLLVGASISVYFPGFQAPEGYEARYVPYPATQVVRNVSVNIGDAHLCRGLGPMNVLAYSQYEGESEEKYLGHDPRHVSWQRSIPPFTARVPVPVYATSQGYIPLFPLHDKVDNLKLEFTLRRNAVHFLEVREVATGRILPRSEIVTLETYPDTFSIVGPTRVRMHTIRLGEDERNARLKEIQAAGEEGYPINVLNYIALPATPITDTTTRIDIVSHNHGKLRSVLMTCGRSNSPSDVGENERRITGGQINVSGVTAILTKDEFELRSHVHQVHTLTPKSEAFCSISFSCSRVDSSAESYFSFAQGVGGVLVVETTRDCVGKCQLDVTLEMKRVLRYTWDDNRKTYNVCMK